MSDSSHNIESLANREYQWGFVTDIEQDTVPPGLDESVIAHISVKKGEPEWMLEWRLKAYRRWLEENLENIGVRGTWKPAFVLSESLKPAHLPEDAERSYEE